MEVMRKQIQPNYVLRFMDAHSVVVNGGGAAGKVQKACLFIIAFYVIVSMLLRENLFGEMSGYTIGVLLATLFFSSMMKRTEWAPCPIELRFYDDYLVVYRDYVPYKNGKKLRQEWAEFRYEDIRLVRWRLKANRVLIEGIVHGVYIWYDDHGNLTDKKKYDKITDSGFIFNTHNMGEIDLATEIETHSPLKVEVCNT